MRSAFLLLCAVGLAACENTPEQPVVEPVETPSATDPPFVPHVEPAAPPVVVYSNGFEAADTACEGWAVDGGKAYTTEAIAASGVKSCRVCMQTASQVGIDLPLRLDDVGAFELSAYVRNEAATAHATMTFTDDRGGDVGTFRAAATQGNDFSTLVVSGTPSRAARKVHLHFGAEKSGGFACIDIDDVMLTRRP